MELFSLFCFYFFATAVVAAPASSLPQVDLGYEIHQAIAFNQSTQIYNFSNIRYAQPPVGNLRFSAPVAPTGRTTQVQNGSVGHICPQSLPGWAYIAANFTEAWVSGQGNSFNYTKAYDTLLAEAAADPNATKPSSDPRSSEDCLFLDVFVPKTVLSQKLGANGTGGAPVLVWIYGGGYVEGSKEGSGSPEYLMEKARAAGSGLIWVEFNYRLGALGFMSGPSLQEAGGVSNAAFYDQRLAIQWVNKYIHLFGGDPSRVTLIGESAGAGSIVHQITAYGGQQGVQFQQAIPQSPAWFPVSSPHYEENVTQAFLKILGVNSIQEARQASSEQVIAAQYQQILYAPYGQYYYGPSVDGIFVPAQPAQLLAAGAFAKDVKIMVGHNSNEGVVFTDPRVKTDQQLSTFFSTSFPTAQPDVVQQLLQLYPAVYSGTYSWHTPIDRTINVISEGFFTCNTNYLDRAFGNMSYAYEFEVPPGLHGEDVSYTFYNGQGNSLGSEGPVYAKLADALQSYIVNFALKGDPNGQGLPTFSQYGMNSMEVGINVTGITPQKDPTENVRCLWWQKGLYY